MVVSRMKEQVTMGVVPGTFLKLQRLEDHWAGSVTSMLLLKEQGYGDFSWGNQMCNHSRWTSTTESIALSMTGQR